MTLDEAFLKIRANIGDSVAQNYFTKQIQKNIEKSKELGIKIDTLSMSLQMEFSRIQGTMLHQLKTKSTGRSLKDIIMNGLDTILEIYGQDEFYKDFLMELLGELIECLTSKAIQSYLLIKELNLIHDYNQIVSSIQDLEYQDVIRILKILIISSTIRRHERRTFIRGC
ncbi:hypothetical protein DSAG12_02709 [Promethearchaeum syntrophicum]|uniref:Uncharacterized protein n=1 Tax=Promethearchaeum syntrophicum TaxID=2594042 RepID=A0A5B9DC59_9ARCH|nr:hypothetical protein [Candidatus Prometheoarchaeum syntrophicum]QEE16879.1 hypothetical protein DSAG12_02709 [Candidatus Prometheoarchaeum syntrophicum]